MNINEEKGAYRMIMFQKCMHAFNFFGRKTFQNEVFVITAIELCTTFAG